MAYSAAGGAVEKVLDFLKTEGESRTKSKKNGHETYQAYEKDFIRVKATLEAEIVQGKENVQKHTAHGQEQRARAEKCGAEMQECETVAAGHKENQKKSKREHDKDIAIKNKDRKELDTAVRALERALSVLRNTPAGAPAFLQQDTSRMEAVVAAIAAVVHAAGSVKSPAAQRVTEMLQLNQPQAQTQTYTSKSGSIIDKVSELLEDAETKLSALDTDIMKARHAFEVTQKALQNAFETEEEKRTQANKCKQDANAQAGEADTKLTGASNKYDADVKELDAAEMEFRETTSEHKKTQERLAKEIAAIKTAVQKLSTQLGGGFLQINKKAGKGYEQRARAASFLRKLGHELKSFGLLQAAASVSSRQPKFGKVLTLITDMIDHMEKKKQEAQDAEEKCKTELAKITKDLAVNGRLYEKQDARLTKITSDIENIKTEIAQNQEELQETQRAAAEADALRFGEAQDHKQEVEELDKAIDVLSSVYEDIKDEGLGKLVLSILQDAIDGAKTEKEESESTERKAQKMHEKVQQARQVAIMKNQTQGDALKNELQSLGVRRNDVSGDRTDAQSNLQSSKELQSETTARCTQTVQSHAERMATMDREIEGLKDAVAILTNNDNVEE